MTTEIVIVTPCLNAADTIDQTIQSVVSQAGRFRLRYHVQDGGSSDGTWERVLWWKERLAQDDWPSACEAVHFSCHQARDAGLYDALVSAFRALAPGDDDFLGWINADDIFLPGTFALVAAADRQFPRNLVRWIGGGVSVLREDVIVAAHDRELPTTVIRAGLCDHEHWHFVQQEGTFFRQSLWAEVDPQTHIRPMKLAGDWNLWRRMAHHADLVQTGRALAAFRVRDGQLSAQNLGGYMAEMDAIVTPDTREQAFAELVAGPAPTRLRLESRFASDALTLVEERVDARLYTRKPEAFGDAPFQPDRRVRRKGQPTEPGSRRPGASASVTVGARLRHMSQKPGIVALDHGWQYPAITEEHAYRQLLSFGGPPDGVTYVAFPWASLIDQLQAKGTEAETHRKTFDAFCESLPGTGPRVTVCQHMLAKQFLGLFEQAGIDHIFWSHATHADVSSGDPGPVFHPFPLYPVQMPGPPPEVTGAARRHLFSFIGARSDPHYLTDVRSWILDRLGDHPAGLIRGREAWHYAKAVYHHQIWQVTDPGDTALVDDQAEREFRSALTEATFALCPSGSGPNSIRLWEALGAGAIPVILSDTHALPGDPRLWAEGAVFCDETPEAVEALPARLKALAGDGARLTRMRQAGRQLWMGYGPQSFVTDVLALETGREGRETARQPSIAAARPAAGQAAYRAADNRLLLYRLGLARGADDGPEDWLRRWAAGKVAFDLPGRQTWPDPDLARIANRFGRLKALCADSADPRLVAIEALAVGAIPATAGATGLDRIVPAEARIDTSGLSRSDARTRCQDFAPDIALAAAWVAARSALARRLAGADGETLARDLWGTAGQVAPGTAAQP